MSARFYFPCPSCDHRFEIETRAAGRQLSCPICQAEVEAPKMGDIRKLELVETDQPASGSGRKPAGRAKSVLFSIGLATMVIFAASGVGLYYYSTTIEIPVDFDRGMEFQNSQLDGMNAADLWDFYYENLKDAPLGDWQEHEVTKGNLQSGILKKFSYGLLGIGALGLLMLLGSFVMPNKR